jgi:glyoxylase-like metal-dependent hydrolase (beta-lactamase superfamily II)
VIEPKQDTESFRVEDQENGIFRIIDPLGVGGNLIVGNERALLIDTGFGLTDIRPAVRQATDLPLIVMNSHVHTDHSGGNYFFDTVYVPQQERDKMLDGSLDRERDMLFKSWIPMRPHLEQHMTQGVALTERLAKTRYEPLPDAFDLGGRVVEIIQLGGHTRASSIVIDPATRIAFVGDAIGLTIWLFLYPEGTIKGYSERLTAFSKRNEIDWLQLSHKTRAIPFSYVAFCAEFVLRANKDNSENWPNNRFTVPVYRYAEAETPYGEIELYFTDSNL